jgi:hypothetical protein
MEACAPVSAAMALFGLGTVLAEAVTGLPVTEDPVRQPRSRIGPDVLTELAAACGARRPWPVRLDPRDATVRVG